MSEETLRLKLEGLGWLAGWRLARALPESFVRRAFERFGERSYRRNPRRRARIVENLTPIVGEARARELARDAFRWYGRYWAETFRMQDLSAAEFDRRFKYVGRENIQNAVDAGTGLVLATPHIGNWDAGGRWVGTTWGLTVVVEVLRPRSLFERFVAHRRGIGMEIVPLEPGGDATARCVDAVKRNGIVALVADRDLTGRGVPVKMFGRATKLPAGPAVLALRTGAPLVPAAIFQREDGSWFTRVMAPCVRPSPDADDPVRELTQTLADDLGSLIAEEPAQWHSFGRHWIDEEGA